MSEKVVLKPYEKEDIDFMHSLFNTPSVMTYWFEEAYKTKLSLENNYIKNIDNMHERSFILTQNKEKLGFIKFLSIDYMHRKAEFAIMIDPKKQGNGFAKLATRLAMDYAFKVLNLNKLYLVAAEKNTRAIHVYEKAGYKAEAILKDEFFVDGSYHNIIYMSMFAKDYFSMVHEENNQ